jgi:hypothetical protein
MLQIHALPVPKSAQSMAKLLGYAFAVKYLRLERIAQDIQRTKSLYSRKHFSKVSPPNTSFNLPRCCI